MYVEKVLGLRMPLYQLPYVVIPDYELFITNDLSTK